MKRLLRAAMLSAMVRCPALPFRSRTTRPHLLPAALAILAIVLVAGPALSTTLEPVPAWAAGLRATTDAAAYSSDQDEQGRAILQNGLQEAIHLPGCSEIELERQSGAGSWESTGPEIVCAWEGVGQRVEAGESASVGFRTGRDAGTWRIRFVGVSVGCQAGQPLSQAGCRASTSAIVTPPFAIGASGSAGGPAAPEPGLEYDTDRPGGDYSSFDLLDDDPKTCGARCLEQARCVAWTYVSPGVQGPQARCWLKSQVPQAVANPCCVSGVKPAAAQDAKAACEAGGGIWGPGGLLPEPLCFHRMPDDGKPCDRQGQCVGHCLMVDSLQQAAGMPGKCSAVDPIFGCYEYLDEAGLPSGICVD